MDMKFKTLKFKLTVDQLGISSKYNTKVYCRQTLIGGNYGLLNTTNFTPNPDYYRQV
jgi:heparanase 1